MAAEQKGYNLRPPIKSRDNEDNADPDLPSEARETDIPVSARPKQIRLQVIDAPSSGDTTDTPRAFSQYPDHIIEGDGPEFVDRQAAGDILQMPENTSFVRDRVDQQEISVAGQTDHTCDNPQPRLVNTLPNAGFEVNQPVISTPAQHMSIPSLPAILEPKPRFPTFNGKQDWESFWVQFECMAKQFGWDTKKQLGYLMSSLQDGALAYVSRLPAPTRMSFSGLVSALRRRFGDNVLPETHRATLTLIKKEARETLQEYAARVGETMAKAYPGLEGSQLYNSMLIEYIVKGLPDPTLVYDVMSKRPSSVEEVLDLIEWHECCRSLKKKPIIARRVEGDHGHNALGSQGSRPLFVTEDRLQSVCQGLTNSVLQQVQELFSRKEVSAEEACHPGNGDPPVSNFSGYVPGRYASVKKDPSYENFQMRGTQEWGRRQYVRPQGGRFQSQGGAIQGMTGKPTKTVYVDSLRGNTQGMSVEPGRRRFTGECYRCHEIGHMARTCPTAKCSQPQFLAKTTQGRLN